MAQPIFGKSVDGLWVLKVIRDLAWLVSHPQHAGSAEDIRVEIDRVMREVAQDREKELTSTDLTKLRDVLDQILGRR
jgi:hypothetical protein